MRLSLLFKKIVYYLLIIILFFGSGYALTLQNGFMSKLKIILLFFGVLIILLYSIILGKRKKYGLIIISLLYIIFLIFTILYNDEIKYLSSYVMYIGIILFCYLFVNNFSSKIFINTFINVMVVFAIISLVITICVRLGFHLPYKVFISYNDVLYHNYFNIFFIIPMEDINAYRICGPFWEPGLHATFLLLSLIFLSLDNKKNILKKLILVIAIVSTESVAGIILLLLVFLIHLFKGVKKIQLKNIILVSLLLIVFIIIFNNYTNIVLFLSSINSSFEKLLFSDTSSQTRVYSFLVDLNIYFTSPLFGIGINNMGIEYKNIINSISYIDSQTSTFGFMMGTFGLGGILYVISFIYGIMHQKGNIILNIIVLTIFIMIFNKEPHDLILISWLILFYFIKERNILINDK